MFLEVFFPILELARQDDLIRYRKIISRTGKKTSVKHLGKLNPRHDVGNLDKNQAEIRVILSRENLKRKELFKHARNKRAEFLKK